MTGIGGDLEFFDGSSLSFSRCGLDSESYTSNTVVGDGFRWSFVMVPVFSDGSVPCFTASTSRRKGVG